MTDSHAFAPPEDLNCLAIETSSSVSTIAACTGGRITMTEYASRGTQSRHVYSRVREVLQVAELNPSQLDFIAFGCGPGAFTGLRVGAAVAQALAFGNGLPVCRVSSLAVLAMAAFGRDDAIGSVAACVDARMGEAYLGIYRRAEQGVCAELEDCLVSPTGYHLPAGERAFAAGAGWSAYPQLFAANAARFENSDPLLAPSADALVMLAAEEFRAGRTVQPHEAIPNYVRDKVTS